MASKLTQLGQAVLAVSTSILYTATNVRATITKATAYNTDASARTVTVYIVPSGGTAGDSNCIIEELSIAAGGTEILSQLEGHTVPLNGSIQALASSAAQVTLTISGLEVT